MTYRSDTLKVGYLLHNTEYKHMAELSMWFAGTKGTHKRPKLV